MLKYVDLEFQTEELCLKAITKHSPKAFKYIKIQKTPEFLLKAVSINGFCIKYIKKEDQVDEICFAALNFVKRCRHYINKEFLEKHNL